MGESLGKSLGMDAATRIATTWDRTVDSAGRGCLLVLSCLAIFGWLWFALPLIHVSSESSATQFPPVSEMEIPHAVINAGALPASMPHRLDLTLALTTAMMQQQVMHTQMQRTLVLLSDLFLALCPPLLLVGISLFVYEAANASRRRKALRQTAAGGCGGVLAAVEGYYHTAILNHDGSVWTSGNNTYGQLGNDKNEDSSIAVKVASDGVQVALGWYHTVVLKEDGSVWTMGYNKEGQLGIGTWENMCKPKKVAGLSDVAQVAAGAYHTIVLKRDGTVWAFGFNKYGQLGDGSFQNRNMPVQVHGLEDIIQISAGLYRTFAFASKQDGSVWVCGWNIYGELGDGSASNKKLPVQMFRTLPQPEGNRAP